MSFGQIILVIKALKTHFTEQSVPEVKRTDITVHILVQMNLNNGSRLSTYSCISSPIVHVLFLVDLCVLLLVVLRVLLPSCECCCTVGVLLYFTLDAELLPRSQHSESPATGHLDTRFLLVSLCLSKSKC